jgi:hypothetical protein
VFISLMSNIPRFAILLQNAIIFHPQNLSPSTLLLKPSFKASPGETIWSRVGLLMRIRSALHGSCSQHAPASNLHLQTGICIMIQSLGCINVTRARAAVGKSLQSLSGGRDGIWGSPEEVSGQKRKSWKLQDHGRVMSKYFCSQRSFLA